MKELISAVVLVILLPFNTIALTIERWAGEKTSNGSWDWIPMYEKSWKGIVTHLPEYKLWCENSDCQHILYLIKKELNSSHYEEQKNHETWRDCVISLQKLETSIMDSDKHFKKSDVHKYVADVDFCSSTASTWVHNRTELPTEKNTKEEEVAKCPKQEETSCEFWVFSSVTLFIMLIAQTSCQLYKSPRVKKILSRKSSGATGSSFSLVAT